MRITTFIPFILIACVALPGCQYESPAERALNELRDTRQTIHRIDAERESGKDMVPIQQHICQTLATFDEVSVCECVIYPQTWQTQTENDDKSITYGEKTEWELAAVITLKSPDIWDKGRAERELGSLLHDNGIKDFTLFPAVESGTTWIVRGCCPVQTLARKSSIPVSIDVHTGLTKNPAMNNSTAFEPLTMLQSMADALAPRTRLAAQTPAQVIQWQMHMRKELASRVRFLDQTVVALEPVVEQEVDRGSYVRRRVVIRTTPHTRMPMYVLIPKAGRRPLAGVLALHGHGYGVKDIVGLWEDGSERLEPDGYHKDFGCELAKNGFLVVAPEISCFGERQVQYDPASLSPKPSTCHHIATFAMMLGGSAIGLRVWDGMRALDYLATLPEADMGRIGAMGISGGGMHTFYSTALDQRIKACVISGYFCDYRHSILAMHHCTCNFVPGLLQLGELSDLAALLAPRPCLVENGSNDEIFPIQHVKPTVEKARRAWEIFGAAADLETDYFEGRHRISGRRAYAFLRQKLGAAA